MDQFNAFKSVEEKLCRKPRSSFGNTGAISFAPEDISMCCLIWRRFWAITVNQKNRTTYWFLERGSEVGTAFFRTKNRTKSLRPIHEIQWWFRGWFQSFSHLFPAGLPQDQKRKPASVLILTATFPILSLVQVACFVDSTISWSPALCLTEASWNFHCSPPPPSHFRRNPTVSWRLLSHVTSPLTSKKGESVSLPAASDGLNISHHHSLPHLSLGNPTSRDDTLFFLQQGCGLPLNSLLLSPGPAFLPWPHPLPALEVLERLDLCLINDVVSIPSDNYPQMFTLFK